MSAVTNGLIKLKRKMEREGGGDERGGAAASLCGTILNMLYFVKNINSVPQNTSL